MDEIKSGKELCDDFFENLLKKEDLDLRVSSLLKDLYRRGELTKEKILEGMVSLRESDANERES